MFMIEHNFSTQANIARSTKLTILIALPIDHLEARAQKRTHENATAIRWATSSKKTSQ
jgi:hypothetical protein